MNYLAIDKHPYKINYSLFQKETKKLLDYGTYCFHEKDENKRVEEIWDTIIALIDKTNPTVVLTHWVDILHIKKIDLMKVAEIKTILRKICVDKKIIYSEFKTFGWEKRITNLDKPSRKAKLAIVREYDKTIKDVGIADAIILGEGVVWNRLQIGKE